MAFFASIHTVPLSSSNLNHSHIQVWKEDIKYTSIHGIIQYMHFKISGEEQAQITSCLRKPNITFKEKVFLFSFLSLNCQNSLFDCEIVPSAVSNTVLRNWLLQHLIASSSATHLFLHDSCDIGDYSDVMSGNLNHGFSKTLWVHNQMPFQRK